MKIPEAFQVKEDGKERYDLCKAFEDMKLEGIEIGLAEGIEKGIEKCVEKFEITDEKANAYAAEYGI